uniref:Uncharacterized protein n=1 Tax=Desertifilum tharense IPPAS B-1220 TaxID=1781255 RepID=A0ACD5GNB9_9CYAN
MFATSVFCGWCWRSRLLKLPFASEVERMSVQIRYFSAIARIDFLSIYELLNDLLW